MKKTTLALIVAALVAMAANPALACGHSSGYRAAHAAKKPAVAKTERKDDAAPVEATRSIEPTIAAPDFMPGSAGFSGDSSRA